MTGARIWLRPYKTHMAIAIARSCIRSGARGRFYNVVDLVNRLEIETRNGRQGRIAEHLTRMDFIVLDELGYLPFAQSGGRLLFHLVSRLYERTSSSSPPTLPSVNGPACSVSRRFHDASLLERLVCRRRARSCLICSSDRLICQGCPFASWWPVKSPRAR
jgi:DNA replication protein DnaC